MIGASLAIGDFMLLLTGAIFWGVLGIAAKLLLGIGLLGGAVLTIRRLISHRRRPRDGASS